MPDINEHEQIRWTGDKCAYVMDMLQCGDNSSPAVLTALTCLNYCISRPDRLFVLTFPSGAASE